MSKVSPNFGLCNSTGTRIRGGGGTRSGGKAGLPGVLKATKWKYEVGNWIYCQELRRRVRTEDKNLRVIDLLKQHYE